MNTFYRIICLSCSSGNTSGVNHTNASQWVLGLQDTGSYWGGGVSTPQGNKFPCYAAAPSLLGEGITMDPAIFRRRIPFACGCGGLRRCLSASPEEMQGEAGGCWCSWPALDFQPCFPWDRQSQVHKEMEQGRFSPSCLLHSSLRATLRETPSRALLTLPGGQGGEVLSESPSLSFSLCIFIDKIHTPKIQVS